MFALLLGFGALAATPCQPTDGAPMSFGGHTFRGEEVFADRVVAYLPGPGVAPEHADPRRALGVPSFDDGTGAVSLGNRGETRAELVVAFDRAALVDGPGPDLYLFEAGPALDAVELAVSTDGVAWVAVGVVSGEAPAIDLAGKVDKGEVFHLLRMRTASLRAGAGPWAGPDIDAVGLLNACATPDPATAEVAAPFARR